MRNKLPKKIKENERGIVNLDDSTNKGTHWICYAKKGNSITYFDSYGNLKPPMELVKYFKSDGRKNDIKYNYSRYQTDKQINCGQLCVEFLYNDVYRTQ